jgi:eukaryotic-like serine/threonine-protein kinase
MDLVAGVVIAGRYRVERRIGAGAMGEVWGGVHQAIGSKVAIKRLLTGGATNPEVVARFRREAVLLGRVRSDYVSRVLDFIEDPQLGLVLVMELIEGESLYDVLLKRRFSVEEAVALGCDVLAGLCDLHDAQIVHRDLKPGNIIMETRRRGNPRAVLVDFGMSRVVAGASDEEEMTGITRADVALGTLEYMAPEQILNSRGVSAAADIYAAGAMLYRSITGQHAYAGGTESALARAKLMQEAPPLQTGRDDALAVGFAATLARSLRRKPNERYQTPQEMLNELHRLRDLSRGERSASAAVAVAAPTQADLRHAATMALNAVPASQTPIPSSGSMERKAMSLAPPQEEGTGTGFIWAIIIVAIVGGVAAFMVVRNPAMFPFLRPKAAPTATATGTMATPGTTAPLVEPTTAPPADAPAVLSASAAPVATRVIPSTKPEPAQKAAPAAKGAAAVAPKATPTPAAAPAPKPADGFLGGSPAHRERAAARWPASSPLETANSVVRGRSAAASPATKSPGICSSREASTCCESGAWRMPTRSRRLPRTSRPQRRSSGGSSTAPSWEAEKPPIHAPENAGTWNRGMGDSTAAGSVRISSSPPARTPPTANTTEPNDKRVPSSVSTASSPWAFTGEHRRARRPLAGGSTRSSAAASRLPDGPPGAERTSPAVTGRKASLAFFARSEGDEGEGGIPNPAGTKTASAPGERAKHAVSAAWCCRLREGSRRRTARSASGITPSAWSRQSSPSTATNVRPLARAAVSSDQDAASASASQPGRVTRGTSTMPGPSAARSSTCESWPRASRSTPAAVATSTPASDESR